ncbi:MAG: hydrogenase maturation nickel metallochaperone HypA [Thermoplasmata archaeon]|nr:hydrogenase maturation nickel metallochaperone HypA [Thermoplasmata archaeon]MCI4354222.1 hydrogenase maturation nickel metallochaperone HypA [Thermoplasmata archaeon]
MHEEALLRDLLRKTGEVAAANGATRVRSLTVWVGALSHLSDSQFRARFALAAEGSVAEGAQLRIERSEDVSDPRAQGIVLVSVEVSPGPGAPSSAARPAV